MTDPLQFGLTVLDSLNRGRAIARQRQQAHAAELRRTVLQLADEYTARGCSQYGMAGRIARRLPGLVTERHVRRILHDAFKKSDMPAKRVRASECRL